LPVHTEQGWRLLSDDAIALFVAGKIGRARQQALQRQIYEAATTGDLVLEEATTVPPSEPVVKAVASCKGRPLLVCEGKKLVGLATAFDFL
jgi:hypothetical protein